MNRHVFAIGQRVFFEHPNDPSKVMSGFVMSVEVNATRFDNKYSVHRDYIVSIPGTDLFTRTMGERTFPTEKACKMFIMYREGGISRKDAYMEQIKSVKDLLNFMFTHKSESDTAAHSAALQRAQELLGFTKEELLTKMDY